MSFAHFHSERVLEKFIVGRGFLSGLALDSFLIKSFYPFIVIFCSFYIQVFNSAKDLKNSQILK